MCAYAFPTAAMRTDELCWPAGFDPNTVCFTVDVEWAADEVLADLVDLFDRYDIRATFFVTHAGVKTPGHERGLHPNFRRNGDTYRLLRQQRGETALSDDEVHLHVLRTTLAFAPEAKGLRAHSLYYDSTLLPLYNRLGLEYDCSYQLPLIVGLRPFWKHHEILEIPTFYGDHFDVITGATGFDVHRLALDRPGMKVFDFHPNLVFLNASCNDTYLSTKTFYHDHDRLLGSREVGKGVRTLLIELLETVTKRQLPTATVGEINAAWRSVPKWT
jgi:peptidoglycan/xylan/chitin deacetylase (PgdA/CDA1 family)